MKETTFRLESHTKYMYTVPLTLYITTHLIPVYIYCIMPTLSLLCRYIIAYFHKNSIQCTRYITYTY